MKNQRCCLCSDKHSRRGRLSVSLLIAFFAASSIVLALDISETNNSREEAYVDWLEKNHLPIADYLCQKIRKFPLVILGEQHTNKRMLTFIRNNIGKFYSAGLRVLALEVCNQDDNGKLARLVTADKFNRGLQLEIARAQFWLTWNAKEQWDLLEAVWAWNHQLPEDSPRLRVVGIDDGKIIGPLFWLYKNEHLTDEKEIKAAKKVMVKIVNRDDFMAAEISKLMEAKERALAIVGLHHAFTRYHQPRVDKEGKLLGEGNRLGNILYNKYKKLISLVILHFPHTSPKLVYSGYTGPEPAMADYLEKLLKKADIQSGGFDLSNSPIGELRDKNSYYFHFQPKYNFGTLANGYLFLGPLENQPECRLIKDFVTKETFEKYKRYFELQYKCKARKELNEMLSSTSADETRP